MGFIFDGLLTVGLVLGGLWLWSLRGSVVQDVSAAQALAAEAAQRREREAREARLFVPGEALRCLGCNLAFAGPMPPDGCPNCHLAALVVTEADYQAGQQAAGRE